MPLFALAAGLLDLFHCFPSPSTRSGPQVAAGNLPARPPGARMNPPVGTDGGRWTGRDGTRSLEWSGAWGFEGEA